MIYIGKVIDKDLRFYYCSPCAWVANMGDEQDRMSLFLKNGISERSEVEPGDPDDVIPIPIAAFVPWPWRHEIPEEAV